MQDVQGGTMAPKVFLFCLRSRIHCLILFAAVLATQLSTASAATTDPVLEWIGIANQTAIASGSNPLVTSRLLATISASVFDSVNGIDQRYEPFHVKPGAARGASANAAAIQAAFVILSQAYPALTPSLTSQRDDSLAALTEESMNSVNAGVAWGQSVADAIWTWRSTDGFTPPPPPFEGVLGIVGSPTAIGVWRPTPLLNSPGAGVQFATMTPWVLKRPSLFRLPPPYALTSAAYATDYDETKSMGVLNGSPRSSDQSELALFWNGNTPLFWDRIAAQISAARSLSLTQNAHLFALLNLTMADAAIACWDSKYRFVFWRPITAIRSGDLDGNPATAADPTWQPWLDSTPAGTPAHPEYPSGHSTVSGSAAATLTARFGDDTPFTVTSDVRPGVRSFASFSAAVAEIADARVFGGIHFRTSCVVGNSLGEAVAEYVSKHVLRARDGDDH
jgi:hypothetical protein